MSFSNIGKVWTVETLREYLEGVAIPAHIRGVTVHHTAFPDLVMRPKGFTVQHMKNIRHGYIHDKGWSAGPHLFVDEDQGFGMTAFTDRGVHAQSFNSTHLGVELLGDFDRLAEAESERGVAVIRNGAKMVAVLLDKLGLDVGSLNYHRDDPQTDKTCPGRNFPDRDFRAMVSGFQSNQLAEPPGRNSVLSRLRDRLELLDAERRDLAEIIRRIS